jgi:oligopeptide/dipeptide ABC transporter ATP-binding protein
MAGPLVELDEVHTSFPVRVPWTRGETPGPLGALRRSLGRKRALVHAVAGVSLAIAEGEVLGLVGESGCGKSTLGRTILRLVEPSSGRVRFAGEDLTALGPEALRHKRRELQMIFQDPFASLNPRLTVGQILAEPLTIHQLADGRQARDEQVAELLDRVHLSREAARRYPHELSGGQRQRVGIARALAVRPRFIVADEPTSALDVSIQAQIVNLIGELIAGGGLTLLFVSHDLNLVAHLCDRVAVMYLGKLVELGPARALSRDPAHPYSRALLSAVPRVHPGGRARQILGGDVPSPIEPPPGCAFHPRCPVADKPAACFTEVPPLVQLGGGRSAACHVVAPSSAKAS